MLSFGQTPYLSGTPKSRTSGPVDPQYRDHIVGHDRTAEVALEGQQQVLRATFPGIRNCVRELLGMRADALARKFHDTHDMAVKDELERLLREYGELGKPWEFVVT